MLSKTLRSALHLRTGRMRSRPVIAGVPAVRPAYCVYDFGATTDHLDLDDTLWDVRPALQAAERAVVMPTRFPDLCLQSTPRTELDALRRASLRKSQNLFIDQLTHIAIHLRARCAGRIMAEAPESPQRPSPRLSRRRQSYRRCVTGSPHFKSTLKSAPSPTATPTCTKQKSATVLIMRGARRSSVSASRIPPYFIRHSARLA